MPLISVIVPVYNLEEEISKCILSLLLQKFSDYEIIAIDDGSTDHSLSVLNALSKKWGEKLQVFHRKNHGLSSTRNFGIQKAKGEFVAFVDGDDFVDPEFLEKLHQSILDSNSDIAVSGYTEFFGEKNRDFSTKRKVLSGKDAAKKLLREQENLDILTWNKLYKKSLFRGIKFPDGKNHEDNFTTYKLYFKAKKVSYIESPLYNYVRREKSITKKEKTIARLNAKLAAAKAAKKYLKETELFSDAEFSEILAFYQFVDFSIKKEIDKKYFKKYREKILESKVKLDGKRKFYRTLLLPFGGIFYTVFRKLIK